ncbi:TPA: fibrillarin-like rRNA/tRNA 2'-O-methyltransferase [Candidatus Micrarchaeota archaeon]|nr:fibrillarin-like rRNA/tRNA 2'-O-methyltransferase [Candidatus Micrarchaeota archaeon]HIH30418.1 fibrillarin-like rRNA/tRNA 2'-O-methyltransferase [Candidatus Micrarchaeota archaeon]
MAEEKFPGVFLVGGRLATRNLALGFRVYGEKLVQEGEAEYRLWDLYRSKLAAALHKGLKEMPIKPGASVLYLGAASGTTASHVSDIVGESGAVYCVEFAQRSARDLISVCEKRQNMLPIMGDARLPQEYSEGIGKVDVIYQDVAQPDQDEIFIRNSSAFLKNGGWGMIAIKSQSIDVTRQPKKVFDEFVARVGSEIDVKQEIELSPYDLDHLFISGKKK